MFFFFNRRVYEVKEIGHMIACSLVKQRQQLRLVRQTVPSLWFDILYCLCRKTCCTVSSCTVCPPSRLQAMRRKLLKHKSQEKHITLKKHIHTHTHYFSCNGSTCRPTCFALLQPWALLVRETIKSICGKLNILPEGETLGQTCDGWATVLCADLCTKCS